MVTQEKTVLPVSKATLAHKELMAAADPQVQLGQEASKDFRARAATQVHQAKTENREYKVLQVHQVELGLEVREGTQEREAP